MATSARPAAFSPPVMIKLGLMTILLVAGAVGAAGAGTTSIALLFLPPRFALTVSVDICLHIISSQSVNLTTEGNRPLRELCR